ncbi:MAG TPA: SMC-Scp complex subunit ScpB [Verrucomicrobiota bacterium]|nr:SMC-Scp complex subunit ScpB [Verrucomicrobiota bacterium]
MEMELKSIIESLLFSSSRPLSVEDIRQVIQGVGDQSEDISLKVFQNVKSEKIEQELRLLQDEYEELNRTWRLTCVAQEWLFVCLQEYAPWIRFFTGERARPPRLTPPALETLAIIAYRQPITRSEIEDIRGVSVDGVMGTLLERKLVCQQGKADLPGRPTLFGTTTEFLQYFGLSSLDDLPDVSELRRYPMNPLQTVGEEVERRTVGKESRLEAVEPAIRQPEIFLNEDDNFENLNNTHE